MEIDYDVLVPILIVGGALILLFSSIVITKQKEVSIIERFGRFTGLRRSGLTLKIPFIERVAYRQSLRIDELGVDVDTITKDKVSVRIRVAVQYYVRDNDDSIKNSVYELSDFAQQIRSYIFNEIRAEVPKKELDEVYENKEGIEDAVKSQLSQALESFGYVIQNALVVDIDPDQSVKEAMNRINAATRDKRAAEEEGEALKIRKIKAAEAEAESKKLQGKGISDQRNAIIKGFEESIDAFAKNTTISKEDIMKFVLMTQYFDTMSEMAKNNDNVIFMPHSPEGQGLISKIMAADIGEELLSKKRQPSKSRED
jgi:regulator of protease activity HflC (stomatin/prohibitin superfamily)